MKTGDWLECPHPTGLIPCAPAGRRRKWVRRGRPMRLHRGWRGRDSEGSGAFSGAVAGRLHRALTVALTCDLLLKRQEHQTKGAVNTRKRLIMKRIQLQWTPHWKISISTAGKKFVLRTWWHHIMFHCHDLGMPYRYILMELGPETAISKMWKKTNKYSAIKCSQ